MKICVNLLIGVALLVVKVDAKPDTRVIGGAAARAGQFPFAAAIHIQTTDSRYFCGGVLITSRWVLTSATCVYNATLFTIQLGSASLTLPDENRQTFTSSEYVIHPEYNHSTLVADVGLIKLRMNVTFSDYIKPVSFNYNTITNGEDLVIIGWGQTSDSEPGPVEHLQYVGGAALTFEGCSVYYGSQVTENMLCFEGNYNEGACIGDNGGPVLTYHNDNEYSMYGIATFISGNGCETTDPSGYTRTRPYYTWVSETINAET